MTCRPFALLALVAALASLATMPAVAASSGAGSGGDATDGMLVPEPLPPVTGPMPQRRTLGEPGTSDTLAADLATLLERYATVTRTAGGDTTVTPPSAELAALLRAELDAGK